MKNVFVAGLMAALLALGCTTTPAATTTTTTDTAAGADATSDTAGAGDTATDAAAGTDAAADTAKTDSTTTTDVKKDTAPTVTKCDPKDNTCMQGCVTDACAGPSADCTKDSKCFALGGCLQGCDKVDLPKDPTAVNCYQKCINTAGAAATTKFYAGQACMGDKCIACKAGDQNCQGICASQLCLEPMFACQGDNACASVLKCLSVEKCSDAACLQGCVQKYPDGEAAFNSFMQCYMANSNSCNE